MPRESSLSATQQIDIPNDNRERRESQKRDDRIKRIIGAAIDTTGQFDCHALDACREVALLGIELTGDCHSDIKDIRTGMGNMIDGLADISTSVAAIHCRDAKSTIPIPLRNGKTLSVPVRPLLIAFGMLVLFAWGVINGDHLGAIVKAYREYRALKAGTAVYEGVRYVPRAIPDKPSG